MVLKDKNIVLGVCGGIAAYKSCDIVRRLIGLEANVECILTEDGSKFITPLTLQTLSKNIVRTSSCMFEVQSSWEIDHVSLAKKADVIAVVPATADTIARLATGRADDLLTCTILASRASVLVCPAMNSNMFYHRATQNNIEILKSYNYMFVMPKKGELACGDFGSGRLADVNVIVNAIVEIFK